MPERLTHTIQRMVGRDPHERGRTATPLELLFDLCFVIAFGVAASELSHAIAEHHTVEGLIGFGFACFAISWAWIFWTWFASAFDTDDWPYRLLTMVQMIGVIVLALGLPTMFASLGTESIDARAMVVGYVVMRIPLLVQWLRVKKADPAKAGAANTYIASIVGSQIIWCVLAWVAPPVPVFLLLGIVPLIVELAGPILAERRTNGTPWHAHHLAERYGLLAIITLGEGLLGTVIAVRALLDIEGWSSDIAILMFAGITLTFGAWWCYFVIPHADLLHAHRNRAFGWGYGHIVIFAALAGIGAGLHVGAYFLDPKYEVSPVVTMISIAVPIVVFMVALYAVYAQLTHTFSRFLACLLAGSVVVAVAGVALAAAGAPIAVCILVAGLSPWVTVIGYELRGYQHNEMVLGAR